MDWALGPTLKVLLFLLSFSPCFSAAPHVSLVPVWFYVIAQFDLTSKSDLMLLFPTVFMRGGYEAPPFIVGRHRLSQRWSRL